MNAQTLIIDASIIPTTIQDFPTRANSYKAGSITSKKLNKKRNKKIPDNQNSPINLESKNQMGDNVTEAVFTSSTDHMIPDIFDYRFLLNY
jgi:hypothetical protein